MGFSSVGFARLEAQALAADAQGLQAWLAQQFHGDMDFMQRHAAQRADPALLFEGARSAIMVTLDYRPADPDWQAHFWQGLQDPARATISSYAWGRDYHKILRNRLKRLALALEQRIGAFRHRAFCDSAPVMEVALAQRAGLGWRGKHTLLLDRQQGSMFFLGSLYTDLDLPEPGQAPSSHCGTCTQCIDICPTQAIVAPYRLDARRCISYLTIEHRGPIDESLRAAIGNRLYGCDDCQAACPWNKFARAPVAPSLVGELAPRAGLDQAVLLDLWSWDEAQFLARTEGSPIRRIGYWRWRRNLIVVTGNALRSPSLPQALRSALSAAVQAIVDAADSDEILREHACWALAQGQGCDAYP